MNHAMFKGGNNNLIKLHNLQVVLLSLLHNSGMSRVQVAQHTNLSNSTISNLIAELLREGIVTEGGGAEHEDSARPVGRPGTGIHLVPDARFVVGVHIGVGRFRAAVVNLTGQVVHSLQRSFVVEEPAGQVVESISAAVEAAVTASGVERARILGVGVGASGLVDFESGVNVLAPNLNWRSVPLREMLASRLGLPVVVDNNVRAMAVGEKYFGAGRDAESLVFIYGRIGVGAGMIYKNEVFRGRSAGAGEIGHNIMLLEGGEPCRCGNSGCLETLVSETAILRQAELLMRAEPEGTLAQVMTRQAELAPVERVFAAAREGDAAVVRLLEERAHYLGVAVANLVNLFNPELIVFGGIFAQGHDLLLPHVQKTVEQTAFSGLGSRVRMQPATFGSAAGMVGAGALAWMTLLFQQSDSFLW